MRHAIVTAIIAAAAFSPSAFAQENWTGVPVPPGQGRIFNGGGPEQPKTSLFGGEAVAVTCSNTPAPAFPSGPACPSGTQQTAYVQLSEFARYSSIESLNKSVGLSSALDIVLPPNGQANRLGLQVTDIAGENGLGLSYAHVSGNFDMGLALSAVGPERAAKVGVGFSW